GFGEFRSEIRAAGVQPKSAIRVVERFEEPDVPGQGWNLLRGNPAANGRRAVARAEGSGVSGGCGLASGNDGPGAAWIRVGRCAGSKKTLLLISRAGGFAGCGDGGHGGAEDYKSVGMMWSSGMTTRAGILATARTASATSIG